MRFGGSTNSWSVVVREVEIIHTNGNRKTMPPSAMKNVRTQMPSRDSPPRERERTGRTRTGLGVISSVAIVHPPSLELQLEDREREDDREQDPTHRGRLTHEAVLERVL